ncbi:MAG: transposase [Rhodospirillaceae bacterium]|nr:transposase [Rhodospirillaceae bacterium]
MTKVANPPTIASKLLQAIYSDPIASTRCAMARLGRWFAPGIPQHIIQRGNNRQPVFFSLEDRRAFRDWLGEIATDHGLAIHAYVLMTNHVHILATPARADSIGRTMQQLGRLYVRGINRAHGRTGTLWEGRYRSTVVEAESYLLAVMRYIELNPVRANMVDHPRDHKWSSYACNALGQSDALVTPHDVYLALGRTTEARLAAYRDLFRARLGDETLANIRSATHAGWALGGERFVRRIGAKAERRGAPLPRGGDHRKPMGSE